MRTNLSKHTCSFSDLAWSSKLANDDQDFPTARQVQAYLEEYAFRFNLLRFINLRCLVTSVVPSTLIGDGWQVGWQSDPLEDSACNAGHAQSSHFNFVIVASGVFSRPWMPDVPGLRNTFKGIQLHSSQYRSPDSFHDKRVLVVGSAFSGAEIAAELARSSVMCPVINAVGSRRHWYLGRDINGKPCDLVFYSFRKDSTQTSPEERHAFLEQVCLRKTNPGNISPALSIEPEQDPPFVAITDTYLDLVEEGKIIPKRGLKHFDERGAFFDDGSYTEVDKVLCATGYELQLPFFGEPLLQMIDYKREDRLQPVLLHKCVFHPQLPGIAFVGIYRGPYFGVIELQARWACMVFGGHLPHPTAEEMAEGVTAERLIREQHQQLQFPHGDYVRMLEDLASRMGVMPPRDHPLCSGPMLPAHFRLVGPFANGLVEDDLRSVLDKYSPRPESVDKAAVIIGVKGLDQ